MYARRKNWPLERVELSMGMQSMESTAAIDPNVTGGGDAKVRHSWIESSLTLHGPPDPGADAASGTDLQPLPGAPRSERPD